MIPPPGDYGTITTDTRDWKQHCGPGVANFLCSLSGLGFGRRDTSIGHIKKYIITYIQTRSPTTLFEVL